MPARSTTVWLGQLSTVTRTVALSAVGIVLPLRHPLHTAKAAVSVDVVYEDKQKTAISLSSIELQYSHSGVAIENEPLELFA
jgi:hypothetical protein